MIREESENIKKDISSILQKIGDEVSEKFRNINGKTAKGNVPDELWQKRTSRQNRVLISWKSVKKNSLTFKELDTFKNGVCVEFVNNDFFKKKYLKDPLHIQLKELIDSNLNVASMISFRVEDGDPGANVARDSYHKFIRSKHSLKLKPIKRKETKISGRGNEHWEGNIFYLIKGGKQNAITSHQSLSTKREREPMLFNPAIEYANAEVCHDLYITLFYFFIHCHDIRNYIQQKDLIGIKKKCENYLKKRNYDDGNLYDYCIQHPSLTFQKGILMDPIQVAKLNVQDFNEKWSFDNPNVVAICHNEAANRDIIKFDKANGYIVSAARPTNLFWGYQSSNMIQQSYSLNEYFRLEEERVNKRKRVISKHP